MAGPIPNPMLRVCVQCIVTDAELPIMGGEGVCGSTVSQSQF